MQGRPDGLEAGLEGEAFMSDVPGIEKSHGVHLFSRMMPVNLLTHLAPVSPLEELGMRTAQGLNTGALGLGFHRGVEKELITRNGSCP